jgi:hypothetical protein
MASKDEDRMFGLLAYLLNKNQGDYSMPKEDVYAGKNLRVKHQKRKGGHRV